VHRARLHLNILFYFVLLVSVLLVARVQPQLVLKKLAVSERGKLLAELDILVITKIATFFCLHKTAPQISFCLHHRSGLRSLRASLVFVLADLHMRNVSISVLLELSISPRIQFAPGWLLPQSPLRHNAVPL
jgi:hypothetical protein